MKYSLLRMILLLLLGAGAGAQDSNGGSNRQTSLCHSEDLLYRPVILAMWSQDEGDHSYAANSGFIRIAVHPTWNQEFFVDIRLSRNGPAVATLYSLPRDAKTVTVLLERALKQHPNIDPESLARVIPVQRKTVQADQKIEGLITEFFTLRWQPRRIPVDSVRLDATEYELEYVGDDTLLFNTDDSETPMVKWIDSLVAALHDAAKG